jgi:chromate reductase
LFERARPGKSVALPETSTVAFKRNVAVLVGSLRKASWNRKMALALAAIAPEELDLSIVEIGNLPLFNQDWEANPPPAVRPFKERINAADAVLFVTPEYNRGVPGVLKNALDVASRPSGQSAWKGKPTAVVSVSPGAIGGFGANHQLRQSFVFLDMPVLQQPEAYIGNAVSLFDDKGAIANDGTRQFLGKFLQAFAEWIERHATAAAPSGAGSEAARP